MGIARIASRVNKAPLAIWIYGGKGPRFMHVHLTNHGPEICSPNQLLFTVRRALEIRNYKSHFRETSRIGSSLLSRYSYGQAQLQPSNT
jgi:hypothetical protein